VSTVFFVWFISKKWFGDWAALIAAVLYATSPVVIVYSRSSWNPNIMPFFSLLVIYSIWKFWWEKNVKWLIVTGLSMAFVLQSHYLGLLLVPVIGLFYLITLWNERKDKDSLGKVIKASLVSAAIFAFLMSPLVIFDARHGWRNFEAMKKFFTQRQTTVSAKPWTAFPQLGEISYELSTRLVAGTNEEFGVWTVWIVVFLAIWFFANNLANSRNKRKSAFLLLTVWIGIALIGLGVYKQEIYDHYYGFFFAAPFILIGALSQVLVDKKGKIGGIFVLGFVGYLLFLNYKETPIKYEPANQLKRSRVVSERIIKESENENFNIAVIAERNYEGAYQYFLEKENAKLKLIDPQIADETVGKYLFVVCELPEEKCDPVNNPKAQVANFGWSKILNKWQIEGVTLFKLGHNQ
jgi:4-amino-4-deoxy-L-arabinose transferase-like glycosyltransferase